jgi:hypothetical protein
VKLVLILMIFSQSVFSYPFKKPRDIEKVVRNYNQIHRKFFRHACKAGDEQKFLKLFREYRGEGFYIPELNQNIDLKAIIRNVVQIKGKIYWLSKVLKKLKKQDFPNHNVLTDKMYKIIDELLELKKKYDTAISTSDKNKYKKESKQVVDKLKSSFKRFTDEIYFLTSYGFPVDHLKNRIDYVKLKEKKLLGKANQKYMFRKIIEDGALDKDNTHPDKFLRSTIDTLALEVPKLKSFLSENVRYDLLFILKKTQRELKKGKKKIIERIQAWVERTEKSHKFYNTIIVNSKFKNDKNKKLMLKKIKVKKNLLSYVLEKQKLTYKFWADQSEMMKAIYSMETILFNEVGRVDGPTALERKDVAKVILNRFNIPFYQTLSTEQPLYKSFDEKLKKQSENEKWLNVLFRKGEFSFTYYYISGNLKIFCPDQTTSGRYLRRRNIKIALNSFWDKFKVFKATRYFSRASMNGRIDMSQVWDDFDPVNERAGIILKNQRKLRKYYKGNLYKYLYRFFDPNARKFEVVEIKDVIYTLTWKNKKPVFYSYRNPHYFKYFVSNKRSR